MLAFIGLVIGATNRPIANLVGEIPLTALAESVQPASTILTNLSNGNASSLTNIPAAQLTGTAAVLRGSNVLHQGHVKWWGGEPNDEVDDTIAIQSALNSGVREIVFEPGTYIVTGVTASPPFHLIGNQATIKGAEDTNQFNLLTVNGASVSSTSNTVFIEDIVFDQNATARASNQSAGVEFINVEKASVLNCRFVNPVYHHILSYTGVVALHIEGCDFFGTPVWSSGAHLKVTMPGSASVLGCRFYDSSHQSIYASTYSALLVNNCTFSNVTVGVDGRASRMIVSDSVFLGGPNGIDQGDTQGQVKALGVTTTLDGIIVTDNVFTNVTCKRAISLNSCVNSHVSGNVMHVPDVNTVVYQDCIGLDSCTNVLLSGNVMHSDKSTTVGIYIGDSLLTSAIGNTFSNLHRVVQIENNLAVPQLVFGGGNLASSYNNFETLGAVAVSRPDGSNVYSIPGGISMLTSSGLFPHQPTLWLNGNTTNDARLTLACMNSVIVSNGVLGEIDFWSGDSSTGNQLTMARIGGVTDSAMNSGNHRGQLIVSLSDTNTNVQEFFKLRYDGSVLNSALTVNGLSITTNTIAPTWFSLQGIAGTNGSLTSGIINSTTPALKSLGTNNIILRCPDGGSFILRIDDSGTITTATNTGNL